MNAHRRMVKVAQQILYHCLHSIKSPGSRNIHAQSLDLYTGQANIISGLGGVHGKLVQRARLETETYKACRGQAANFHAFKVKLYLTGLGIHNKEQYL